MLNVLLLIMAIALVIVYNQNKHKIKGARGESKVARQLKKLPKDEYRILNNLYFETSRGTSQIDHVVVSVYGIFVVETKYYKGWIHGHEKSEYWTQSIYKSKTKFRNPIKQNWAHIYALKEVLTDFKHVAYHPIIVFAGSGELKNITSNIPVIYSRQLFRTIRQEKEVFNLNIEQVNSIVAKLNEVIIQNRGVKREHVRKVKHHVREQKRKVRSSICPRCDGDLVLRKGQHGKFYGCSNYPKCRFTKPY